MKILVTGADGFIGSHLTEILSRSGFQVTALSQYNSFNNWGWLEESDCLKNIETDSTFTIIFNIALLVFVFLDFWYRHFDYIGLVCCALLFVFGGPIKWSHPNFLPLRHYADD